MELGLFPGLRPVWGDPPVPGTFMRVCAAPARECGACACGGRCGEAGSVPGGMQRCGDPQLLQKHPAVGTATPELSSGHVAAGLSWWFLSH